MSERLEIHVSEIDDATWIRLVGEVDLTTVDAIEALAVPVLVAARPLVLDCRGIDFIDSTGLSMLVKLYHRGAAHGTTLRLFEPQQGTQRLLDITGIGDLLGA